jgi:hypothetical protein
MFAAVATLPPAVVEIRASESWSIWAGFRRTCRSNRPRSGGACCFSLIAPA